VKGDEGILQGAGVSWLADDPQSRDARKGMNPTTLSCICGHGGLKATNRKSAGMISRGAEIMWERLLPQLKVKCGTELDIDEKVFSGTRNP